MSFWKKVKKFFSGDSNTKKNRRGGSNRNRNRNDRPNSGNHKRVGTSNTRSTRGGVVKAGKNKNGSKRENKNDSWTDYVNNVLGTSATANAYRARTQAKAAKEKKKNDNKPKNNNVSAASAYAYKAREQEKYNRKNKIDSPIDAIKQWSTGDKEWSKQQREKQGKEINGLGTYVKNHKDTYKFHDTAFIKESEADRQLREYFAAQKALEDEQKNWKPGYSNKPSNVKIEPPKNIKEQKAKDMGSIPDTVRKKGEEVVYRHRDLGSGDYRRMETAAMTGQLRNLMKNDDELRQRVTDQNVADYVNGAFGMGALDQMTMGSSVSDDPLYKYSEQQRKILDDVKSSGKYNAGRIAGGVAEFALAGTGALGSALAKTAGKQTLKNVAKSGGKELAKTIGKNAAKETGADALVSLPLNSFDALKASYKNGKFDKGTFAKELALNVGGDVVLGGALSGVTHGLSAKQVLRFNSIGNKIDKGTPITTSELKFYNKHVTELADKVKDKVKEQSNADTGKNITNGSKPSKTTEAQPSKAVQQKNSPVEWTRPKSEYRKLMKIRGKLEAGIEVSDADRAWHDKVMNEAMDNYVKKQTQIELDRINNTKNTGTIQLTKAVNAEDVTEPQKVAVNRTEQATGGIDSSSGTEYNNLKGEIENGKEQIRTDNLSNDSRGTENIQQTERAIQGRQGSIGVDISGTVRPDGEAGLGGMRGDSQPVLLKNETRNKMNSSGIVDTNLSGSDYATFSSALDNGKANNPHGGYVDPQSVENLTEANAKTFLSDDGSAGVAVKGDGGIVDVNTGTLSLKVENGEIVNKNRIFKSNKTGAEYKIVNKGEISIKINNDGSVEVVGTPLKDVESKDLRDYAKKYAEENYLSTFDERGNLINARPIKITSDNKTVIITKKGVNDVSEKIKSGSKSKAYADSMLVLDNIIENAIKYGESPNTKGRENPYSYYNSIFKNSNGTYSVDLRIKDTPDVSRYHYHTLAQIDDVDIKKIESPYGTSTKSGDTDLLKVDSISNNSIHNKTENINKNSEASDSLTPKQKQNLEIQSLKKEQNELRYKIQRTENSEHYIEYIKRREEINDRLDELYEKQGVKNIETPKKEVVEKADDLVSVAQGKYSEVLKNDNKRKDSVFESFMRLVVDSFRGFEKYALDLPKEARDEMQSIINSVRNSRNKAGGWLTEKRVSVDGKITGDSLKDILGDLTKKSNAEKYTDFQYYCANKHNIDRYANGKGVFGDSVTSQDSKDICKHLEEKYPDFAKKQAAIKDYLNDLQQYRVDTGLISKSTKDYLDALYHDYVPTYRVKDGKRVNIVDGTKKDLKVGTPLKTATGGTSELLPLHEQIAQLTDYTFRLGEENRLFKFMATTQGIDVKNIDSSVRLENAVEACTLISKQTDGATNKYTMSFYDNGKVRHVELNKQMYEGIREWKNDADSLAAAFNWKARPVRAANTLFKNLITGWNVLFGATNIIKDTGEALLYTKNTKGFIASYPKAIAAVCSKDSKYRKYFELYQASGGKYAHLRDVLTTFNTDSVFKKIIKSPIKACETLNDCLEAIPRMAEFISTIDNSLDVKTLKRTMQKDFKPEDVLDKMNAKTIDRALRNANEVTLNFGRKGVAGSAFNSTIIPYLNPAIQGLDKLRRTFVEAGADGTKGILSLCGKMSAFMVAPAMFNEVMMTLYGGKDYQILNTRDKDNYYFIPMGDGKFIKIPKPRVGAAMSSPFAHFYRHAMYGDNMEWKQLWQSTYSNIGVQNPAESSLFSPILLAMNNKTWYGGTIENASDLDLRKVGRQSEIYDETTSAIGILVGEKFNVSPKKVDYILDAYTGVIGDFALPMTTEAANNNPIYKKFVIDSVFSNKLATNFWDKNARLEAGKNVEKKGNKASDKYDKWKAEYLYDASTLNQAIHDVDADKNLSKNEKLKLKRSLRKGLNDFYQGGITGKSVDIEPVGFIARHIGADKALKNYLPDNEDKSFSFKEHYNEYKKTEDYKNKTKEEKKKIAQDFLNTYTLSVKTQKRIDVSYHNTPDWTTMSVVNAQRNGRESIAMSCGVNEDSIKAANKYIKFGGNINTYVVAARRNVKVSNSVKESGINVKGNLYKHNIKSGVTALGLAKSPIDFKDRAYYILGSYGKMNAARGLSKKYDWSTEEVAKLGIKADSDKNTYYKKQEVIDAINNSKAKDVEEKAMLFVLLYGSDGINPFGSIGDYSIEGDTGITDDESGGGRGNSYRRYGRGRGGSRGSGGTTQSWESYLKELGIGVETERTSSSGNIGYKKSALTDAYRKRQLKILQNNPTYKS